MPSVVEITWKRQIERNKLRYNIIYTYIDITQANLNKLIIRNF